MQGNYQSKVYSGFGGDYKYTRPILERVDNLHQLTKIILEIGSIDEFEKICDDAKEMAKSLCHQVKL